MTQGGDAAAVRAAHKGLALGAGALVLLASLANFLAYNEYSLFRPEVGLVAMAMIAISLVVGGIYLASGRLVRALLEAFLVYFAIDLNSDAPLIALLIAIAVFAARFFKSWSALPAIAIIASVVLLTSPLGLAPSRPALHESRGKGVAATTAPAIVHLILDAHVGIEGIPSGSFREQVARFYASRNFSVFERAYGRHFRTINSVPDILNLGGPAKSRASKKHVRVGETAWFSRLSERGYAAHIFESEYADYCSDIRFAKCVRYWSPSMAFLEPVAVPPAEKAMLIASKLAALSTGADALTRIFDILVAGPLGTEPIKLEFRSLSNGVGALAAMDAFTQDLKSIQPGNVYFAHILLPHYPYLTSEACAVLPPSQWEYRRSSAPQGVREAAYQRQLQCVLRKMDEMMTVLAGSPAGREAIIIVHGDHGSRISSRDPTASAFGALGDHDLTAGFSTLFAVRAPGLPGGRVRTPASVAELMKSLIQSDFASTATRQPGPAEVYLEDRSWKPVRKIALPRSWQSEAP